MSRIGCIRNHLIPSGYGEEPKSSLAKRRDFVILKSLDLSKVLIDDRRDLETLKSLDKSRVSIVFEGVFSVNSKDHSIT